MSAPSSISHWLGQLQAGNQAAAQEIWQRYFQRLVGLARKKLQGSPRRAADEEDVALSAFKSFCLGAEAGRFPQLEGRDDLWQVLVMLTARKSCRLREHDGRLKRGGGAGPVHADLEQIIGAEPTPEFAAQVAEEFERRLQLLDDEELRQVAVWKMEGYANKEIADKLECVERSVERKLWRIRRKWDKEIDP